MTEYSKMYWIQNMTPLHAGTGKGIGFVDVPIAREKITNWPYVPGSTIKGVMRDYFKNNGTDINLINAAFGTNDNENSNSGALILTDAHLVCFPVRSLYGTFAYTTSPVALERLKRDLEITGYNNIPKIPDIKEEKALHTKNTVLVHNGKIFFEELDFNSENNGNADEWADFISQILYSDDAGWQKIFRERFAILSENSFNFISETGTEVSAHIKIDDKKKVAEDGGLWYEEALPPEALLSGLVWCDRIFGKYDTDKESILKTICCNGLTLQIGGKATVGKGRVKCLFSEG
jgi:CRISPR-associated protein Cmr4